MVRDEHSGIENKVLKTDHVEVNRIWRVFQIGGITIAIVAGLAAILTFIGTRRYLGLHERLTENYEFV